MLDTDHLSELLRAGETGLRLEMRLVERNVTPTVSIVTVEETLRGRLAQIAKSKGLQIALPIYGELHRFLEIQTEMTLISWTEAAVAHFERLSKAKLRVGTMDLKIAAIALANDAILLSRNLRDFKRIPDLQVEDWTT